ncbi:MAG: DivIVA domain-containing protein [Spirosomataceae bacterium]
MKITPLEIRKQQFEKTFRGYLPEQVDTFLSNLSSEWERIVDESKMLRMQLEIAEKEANKFRDIQSTLFKALKTAEDTAQNMLEQATYQADKNLQDAASKAEHILAEAYAEAERIRTESNAEVFKLRDSTLKEMKQLERDFKTLENYRSHLVVELKSLANATLDNVVTFEGNFDPKVLEQKFKEANQFISELPSQEFLNTGNTNLESPSPSSNTKVKSESNDFYTEQETVPATSYTEEVAPPSVQGSFADSDTDQESSVNPNQAKGDYSFEVAVQNPLRDDFTLIDGITNEISESLVIAGITTFRALSCLPPYKVHEVLTQQGHQTESFDVTDWIQIALSLAKGIPPKKEEKTYVSAVSQPPSAPHVEESTQNHITSAPHAEPKIVSLKDIKFVEPAMEPEKPKVVAKVNGKGLDESVDYEDKTNSIIQSLRSSMIQDGKQNGRSKDNNGQMLRLGDILNDSRRNDQTGSFFDNL